MTQREEEGWPLGLQPLNVRVGLPVNRDFSGSVSFNTLITGSPTSSTDSSSDLDTESTGSFFQDKSITLGSLIGVSSILELSGRSVRGRRAEASKEKKTQNKPKTWLFSLCSRDSTDAENVNNPASLGHFLAVERRAATDPRRNQSPILYGADEFSMAMPSAEQNSLFVDGRIAPPPSSPLLNSDIDRTPGSLGNGYGVPVLFSCICGEPSHS